MGVRSNIPRELEQALREMPAQSERLHALWGALGEVRERSPATGTDEAWASLQQRLEGGRTRAADRPPRTRTKRRYVAAAGVSLALLIGVAVASFSPVSVEVGAGDQKAVTLADGSRVELNSASKLSYRRQLIAIPFVNDDARTVRLEGEAFFSVRPAARPFVVETEDARVEVLGTRFNVRSRSFQEGSRTLVTLDEGRVRVSPLALGGGHVTIDSSGAAAAVEGGLVERVTKGASLEHVLAWRNQGFAVVNEPIGDILREVRRRFAVDVRIEDDLPVDEPMTVFYLRGATAEQIIHDVCLARGWQYRETSRGFALFAGRDTISAAQTVR